jgi:hypothetical protein
MTFDEQEYALLVSLIFILYYANHGKKNENTVR